jgi:hypothetical protein
VAQQPTRFDPTSLFLVDVLTDILQAAKEYEKHCEANGKPVNHAKAKELLYVYIILCAREMHTYLRYRAGFAGAFIDRELETKGVSDLLRLSRADVGSDPFSSGQISSTSSTRRRRNATVSRYIYRCRNTKPDNRCAARDRCEEVVTVEKFDNY